VVEVDRTTKYAREVLAGNIPANELVILACKRHMNDLKKSVRKKYPYKFDKELADRAINFFPFLKHTTGEWAGRSIELELWQCFIVGSVFGWVRKADGIRRFRIAYVQVPRKNGKSTLAAGIALYGLLADGEARAEIYSAATKRDQAKIIFEEAKRMVMTSSELKSMVDIYKLNLSVPATFSKFEPLASEADSLDGLNVYFALIDELHAHKTRELWDVLETATGARRQPLMFPITTAGFNHNGICYEQYEYSTKILKNTAGMEDDRYFAYIAQMDPEDDWRDPETWAKANPNLGVSVKLEDLEAKVKKAMEIPAAQNNFLCKHLNVWVNSEVRWMDMEKWRKCPTLSKEEVKALKLEEIPCIVGVDLSATTDITSINFEFSLPDGRVFVHSHSFIPEDKVDEKIKRDKVPYRLWEKQGYLTFTPGGVVDYDWIISYIMTKAEVWDIKEICYDPWNATQMANTLTNEGFLCVEIRQGYKTLSEPTKDVYKLVLRGKYIHNNNPVLSWAMSNAVAVSDPAGNIKLDKSKAQYRIDPAVAAVISHVRAILRPYENESRSVYSERGIAFI
jgi:phage terminase large subunit-like protein